MARSLRRAFSSVTLPDLPYDYHALEPVISANIMKLHHAKHHQAYVTNYNIAMEKTLAAQAKGDLAQVIALQPAIRFNGGGHLNHSIFWTNLASPKSGGGGEPTDKALLKALVHQFGSVEQFKQRFNGATAAIQGSGWGWLAYDPVNQQLLMTTCANQDPLPAPLVPLLGIDVWEHAYYLDYKNARPDYLQAIWQVVNWKNVAQRYAAARPAA